MSDERPDPDMTIQIAGHRFDPLAGDPDLPGDLVDADEPVDPTHYLVQLNGPPTREQRETLQRRHRLAMDHYVGGQAYLERIDPARLERVGRDELVRAVVRYQPGFKISPDIGQQDFRTDERSAVDGLLVWVVLFPIAEPDTAAGRIRELGGDVRHVVDVRELGGPARVQAVFSDADQLRAVARLEEVRWIEEVGEIIDDSVGAATTNHSGTSGTSATWGAGLDGEGQIIGVIDAGLPDINHCFFQDPVDNAPGPSHRKIIANRNGSGSHWHSTFAAACAAGDDFNNPGTGGQRGGAWAARLVCGRNGEVFSGSALAEFTEAASFGAVIHTNSWHEDNTNGSNQAIYSQMSVDTDQFCWNNEDHLVLGSSGNTATPPEEQGAPGTAKNAICVTAAMADPNENSVGDGNPGPTADGRRKPDLVGVGCGITSAQDGTACGTVARGCATSWATPQMAACAALTRQYFTEGWYPTGTLQPHHAFVPSGALLKAMLLNSTRNMTGVGGGYPNNTEGWGIVRLDDVLHLDGDALDLRVWDTRNVDGLATGETAEHHVDVATNTQRLKVTLVWTEPPSANGATTPLVNDLDLEVVSPGGTQTFRGNDFSGGVSTTGGAADSTENVETVLVNAPAPGDWTIRVVASAVNVGNPGQGYAVVVTADLIDAPATTGTQDTLVVRAQFSDVAFEPSLPNLQNVMTDVAAYIDEVSYGQTSVAPAYRGPIMLDHPKSYYYHSERNLLVELAEEVIAKLVGAEPDVFTGDPADPADDIDRIIIVTNDVNFTDDWATTGPWPYSLPGGLSSPISVSVQSYANGAARFTHGFLHQVGLVDLYAHPGVVFPRPYVDEWDNMAGLFQNVHPLVWSKERAAWVTGHGSTIEYIQRPAAGSSYTGTNPIRLYLQESTATNRKAIALGLTEGAAMIGQENAFYFVEARSNSLGGFDDSLPESGVLVYYVNELIPQGEGPVIVRDDVLATTGLADAALEIGDTLSIPGTGITIEVLAGTGGAAYDIDLSYTPPVTDYNVRITRGDTIDGKFYNYFSPDVWVDSPRNGYTLSGGPPAHADRDDPVIGEINRVYARIWNDGPATAYDFDIRFRISEPYHTVGGTADFDKFVGIAHVDSLAPGSSVNRYVNWTPADDGESHACLMVDIINLVGTDTNPNDHAAQENLTKATSVTASPFHPVDYSFRLTNPYDEPALFYFRADGAPPDWSVVLSPRKILLQPGEEIGGVAKITPPEDAKVCTSEMIQVTSWTPRGDTLINVGGGVVQVDLRRRTTMTLDVDTGRCTGEDLEELFERLRHEKRNDAILRAAWWKLAKERHGDAREEEISAAFALLTSQPPVSGALTASSVLREWDRLFARTGDQEPEKVDPEELIRDCMRVTAAGCTNPPHPHEKITVKFVHPDGTVEYQEVETDEHGCFEAFVVSVEDGSWSVTAEYPGTDCDGPATAGPRTIVTNCDCRKKDEREG